MDSKKEVRMYFTGFADEAGKSIEEQIAATKRLGWSNIESRNIDGVNIHDIDDEQFDHVCGKLEEASIHINCFGSAVANWSRHPRSDEDYQKSLAELKRAIPRMQRLGTKMIRGMSFAIPRDEEPDSPDLEKIIFRKVNELVAICSDAGIDYMHENCRNYGGLSYRHSIKLVENVPGIKLVFDTGNPPMTDSRIGEPPYHKQSSLEFFRQVREFVGYIHVKDTVFVAETDGVFPEASFVHPGEGEGEVREVLSELLKDGYDGGISIEPHMASVFHSKDSGDMDSSAADIYVEYGQRVEKMAAGFHPTFSLSSPPDI